MTPATPLPAAMSLTEYAAQAQRTDRFLDDPRAVERLRFGYFGEVGGLLAAIKKVNRDELQRTETDVAAEELGDALWYLVSVANALGVKPDDLAMACIGELRHQFEEAPKPIASGVTLRQIDGVLEAHRDGDESARAQRLGTLAHEAGVLALEPTEQLELQAAPTLVEHFGKLLAGWARTCAAFSLRVEDVAIQNVEKIANRWPGPDPRYADLLDDDSSIPPFERLPRKFTMVFEERGSGPDAHVVQSLEGVFVGDRLTDNSNEQDDYRFHDVFHLAYIAHLGWSPVIRGLLKRKRKYNRTKDENEDGARAMIIEEAIATWIFNHAKARHFYEHIKEGKLDYSLLKQIQSMVEGYEVDNRPLWQWERAILAGFAVFRQLKAARRGKVIVDMLAHSIIFEPLEHAVP